MHRISRVHARFFVITLSLLVVGATLAWYPRYRAHAQFQLFPVTVVSAATFEEGPLAPDSIASAFGQELASATAVATTVPLPLRLGGISMKIKDSAGVERDCGLFFVSRNQVNFLIPAGIAAGAATITIARPGSLFGDATATIQVAATAPGLFSANSSGQGAAQGLLLSVPQQGGQSFEPLARFDDQFKRFVTRPVLLDRTTIQSERLFFILYGTGVRGQQNLRSISLLIGGIEVPVSFAGAVPNLAGLDQINVPIESFLIRQLTGRGRVNVALRLTDAQGVAVVSNLVEIEIADRSSASPAITGIEPSRALAGDTVTINGSGFSSVISASRVRVGGVEAQVMEASASQLKIKVPFGAETGPVAVSAGGGEAVSRTTLAIRTSISGFVEDTRRRPVIGVTVRAYPQDEFPGSSQPLASATTNSEGVFLLRDVPTGEALVLDIDGTTASATPRLPRFSLIPTVLPGRDNQLPRPVPLQIPTTPGIKVNKQGVPLDFSLDVPVIASSFGNDWEGASDSGAEPNAAADPSQQICNPSPGSINFELPSNSIAYIPCTTLDECQDTMGTIYVSQVENSRAPVRLPTGHFSSMMVQVSPFGSFFLPGGQLTWPNSDCLSPGLLRVFKLQTEQSSSGIGGGFSAAPPGQFTEIGPATLSADGQRITTASGLIREGGMYFVSVKRPTTTIIGRVFLPADSTLVDPAVRRAIVTARGQEAMTDGAGSFILRNVPVLFRQDKVAIEISLMRPNGRVERAMITDVAITPNGVVTVPQITLPAPESNRPPVILASASISGEEGKRTDFNFIVSDADPNQTLQVTLGGPPFASLINRGNGAYSLRLAPGIDDAGDYSVTITATDNLDATARHTVAVRVINVNQAPAANPQTVATNEDKPREITLTGSDPERNALNYAIVTRPVHGKLTGDAPDLIYTPDEDYFGADSFTFKVNDGLAESKPVAVSITINPVNDAPRLVVPIEQKVAAGQTLNLAITASEVDPTDAVTLTSPDLPTGATFSQIASSPGFAGQFSWTPSQLQSGTFVITFKATDNGNPAQSTTRTLAITVTAPNAPANAGVWTPTGGPEGGDVNPLFANGSTILAGAPGSGVLRSTDNGETWNRVGAGRFASAAVRAFTSIGNALLAGTSAGIFRSTDGGATWSEANNGLAPENISIVGGVNGNAFAVKGSLVFTTANGTVYVSSDSGQRWAPANNGLPRRELISTLTASGSSLFAATFNLVGFFGGSTIYRSNDDGKNWAEVRQGLPDNAYVSQLISNGGTVYVVTTVGGLITLQSELYSISENGQSWVRVATPLTNTLFMFFTADQWLASSGRSLYELTRQANNQITAKPLLQNQFIQAIAANNTSLFVGTLLEGVSRSTDKGQNWKPINASLTALNVNVLHRAGPTIFAGTSAGVFASDNQGKDWRAANVGLGFSISLESDPGGFYGTSLLEITSLASVSASGTTYLFAVQYPSVFYRSSDLGKKWEKVEGLPGSARISALGANGATIFAGVFPLSLPAPGVALIYRSTDGGKTWNQASNGIAESSPIGFATIGSNLFAVTSDSVYVSSDNGDNWKKVISGLPEKTVLTAIAAGGSTLYVGTVGKGVYLSTNNGQSWAAANNNLPPETNVLKLLAIGGGVFAIIQNNLSGGACPPGSILIDGICYGAIRPGLGGLGFVSAGGSVYFSPNQGANWAPILSGLGEAPVRTLGASDSTIFAGTSGSGVFTRQF